LRPKLILFCGIPGSGKTTIATALSAKLNHSVLAQTDRIRGMVTHPKYTSAESKFVYRSLVSLGMEALHSGYDTILEGTFPREEYRREALDILAPLAGKSLVVQVICEPELAFGRNAGRVDVVPWESFLRIYTSFEDPVEALRVDTTKLSPEQAAHEILSALG